MDSIINSIISNYLADYLEINPEKTKTSILSGTVELSGVKFKKSLFTTLNLPYLELEEGFIGKINVNLTLPIFYLHPIIINVDKIYIKIRPKNVNKISEEEIIKTFEIYKEKKLKEFEELMNIKFSYLFEDEKNPKDNKKKSIIILENIINNLHINIRRIVFIFDDCVSNPKYPCTFGVTLNQLLIDSTSKDFTQVKEEDKSSPFKYKKLSIVRLNTFLDEIDKKDIIKVEKTGDIIAYHKGKEEKLKNITDEEKNYLKDSLNFYLYCESEIEEYSKFEKYHSYLLKELDFEIKLTINEKYELNDKPQFYAVMETSTIFTQISNRQIKAIINNINYISIKDCYQQKTIDDYYKTREKIDDDTIKKYLEDYSLYYKTKYIEIYKNNKENKIYLDNMKEIEKNLNLDNIKALRELGNEIINNIIEIGKLDKEIKNKEKAWSNFFKKKNSKDIAKLKEERQLKIEEQNKIKKKNSNIEKFKNYVEDIFSNDDDIKNIKEDKIRFKFIFIMKELILILKEEKLYKRQIFKMKFNLFQCDVLIKSISQYIKLSLRDMEFNQYISENKEYKKILYSKLKNDNNNNNINSIDNIIEYNDNEVSLILIEFEHNHLFQLSPFKFKLHFDRQMYIIIDYYYLYYLYNLFLRHISHIDFNNLTSMLNEKIYKIIKVGYKNLLEKENNEEENKNDKLFNINVDILLNAPIILLPLYFNDKNNTEMMYISLGQLKINNELADENKKEIYDKYIIDCSDITIKTLKKYSTQENIENEYGEKLIYPSSFNIIVENYIYKSLKLENKIKKDFSPLLINIIIYNTQFGLSEDQIIFIIRYLENFQITKFKFEKEIERKEKLKNKKKAKDKKEEKEEKEDVNEKGIQIIKKEEKEKNKEIKDKKEEGNINDKKDEKLKENKSIKDIINKVKISIKFGKFKISLFKSLIDKKIQCDKKKKFLLFLFRESTVEFLMKSNDSIDMEISFGHFYLYDEDYKLDENQNEIPYINPEFKCIIGTSALGIRDKKTNNIKFSEIFDDFKINRNLKESIQILFTLDAEKNITYVNIFMSKLTISPNFSTLTRLYIFLNKYIELYNESMSKIKYEKLKDKIEEDKKEDEEFKKKKTEDFVAPPPINILDDKIVKLKDKEIIKSKEYSVINVLFSMKGIDLYIPIDPNSHNTSIIFMTIETPIKYILETDVENQFSDSKLIKIIYNIKSIQLLAEINKGYFSIYDYKNDEMLLNSINQIFDDIDFSIIMNSKLDKNQKTNKFNTIIQMNKAMNISININHIIVFMDLFNKINMLLNELNKEENNVKKKEEFNILEDEYVFKKAKTEELIKIKNEKKQKQIFNFKEEKEKINIINYNKIFIYEFKIENISIKFYDIIDGIYQSLFEFSMIDTKVEMFQNNNPKDCSNLMKYLINTFSNERKELNNYDKNNFYMYFNILTNIEIKSLNNYLNQWEYFVEPLSVKFYYCQFLKRMRPNVELLISNMININLSLNFAKILSFTMQKFSMNREQQIQKNKKENLFFNQIISETPQCMGSESPILILENYTGVDMEIWFDNIKYDNSINKDIIINLKNNTKFEITSSLLVKYNIQKINNNLNSTLSYKFCFDEDLVKNSNINQKNLIGNYFNINYHHIDIHDLAEFVKIFIESCSDNMLCRHIIFKSLISIKNDTKFKDIQLFNNKDTQKIVLIDNKIHSIPISWFLFNENKSINLSYNNKSHILMENILNINEINKFIKFNNNDFIIIDVIKYKINLEEYYYNKNLKEKDDIFRVDIILSAPINLINNTPYEFYVNNDNKILSTKSLNIYNNNFNLLSNYIKIINEKGKKKKNIEKEAIMKIIRDIKLQIKYENKLLDAITFIDEKDEFDNDKIEEGKSINNFSSYNKNLSILLKNKNNLYLICRLFFNNPYEFISYNNKIYNSMKVELNSFKYEITFDYYFVNRTNIDLYLNNKVIDGVNTKNINFLIPAKNYAPLSKVLLNNKVKFKINNNYWSDKIEISAIGEEFTLNIKNNEISYYPFAIKIRISDSFNKSITLVIENKYIVINDLPFDIILKEEKLSTRITIKPNENKILLLNEESLKNKNNYRIGIEKCYSHMFDIDKLGFYDLLVSYNEKVFNEKNIDVENKLIELNNKKYYPIRCIINTINKNIIYILFSYNKNFINQFENHTPHNLEIILNGDKQSKYLVKPEKAIPLIYFNDKGKYETFEKVKINFNEKASETVSLNEITTKYSVKNKNYVIKIQPNNNNSVKCIKVFIKYDRRLKDENYIKDMIKKFTKVNGYKIKLFLYGLGFSIINESPKEIFYLSLYDIYLCYKYSNVFNILDEMENYNSLLFSIKNLQLDYCLDNAYDIVFNPTNQLLPQKSDDKNIKKEKKFLDKVLEGEVDNTPFIQFVMSQKLRQTKTKDKNKLIYSFYPEIALFIQEFDFRINTILLNSLIKVINEYIQIFKPKDDIDNAELNYEDNNNEINLNESIFIIENYKDENLDKLKDKLLNKKENINNLIINNLTLSAIKGNITFKVNKNAIEIKYMPELIITLINTLCSTLSSFSDATLKLNEISFSNVFSDFDSLSEKLITYYKNQILAQLYKIILNIDLLGNPINLLEGLGTGLFQLFNEPRKGLLKGPEEFGLGLTRGARALVSNVVGGGFNSVSKITGTLLNATKNLSSIGTEEEIVIKEEEKPKGLLSGALSGFKKGFGELTHGVAGIVTKPVEQSKKGGVGGFFKGLGSGIVGAVLAPVNTVLTVGTEVTSGISNSEFISNKKRIRRFRLPRTLYKYLPIMPYDEIKEIERKKQREKIEGSNCIIISLGNEKLFFENSTQLVMCQKLSNSSSLIFTDVMIKILNNDCSRFIKKIYVCDIKNVIDRDNNIELVMKNENILKLNFKDIKAKDSFINNINRFLY